jgi:hypothetical protein
MCTPNISGPEGLDGIQLTLDSRGAHKLGILVTLESSEKVGEGSGEESRPANK